MGGFWRRRELWMCGSYLLLAVGLSLLLLSDLVFDDLLGGMRVAVASAAASVLGALGLPIVARGAVMLRYSQPTGGAFIAPIFVWALLLATTRPGPTP
jgi:hypothetical protein